MHSKLFLLKNYVIGVSVLSRINLCLHRLSRKHLPNAFSSRHFQLLSETNLAAQRPYAKHYSLIINNFLCIIFPMFSSLEMLLHSTKLLNLAKNTSGMLATLVSRFSHTPLNNDNFILL